MNNSLWVYALDFPPTIGGVQTVSQEIYGRLADLMGGVVAPACAAAETWTGPITRSRFPAARGWRTARYLQDANRLLRTRVQAPGVIHCNHIFAGVAAPRLVRPGVRYVVWVHGEELTKNRYPALVRRGLRHAAGILTISDFTADLVRQLLHGAGPPIHKIPLGAPPAWVAAAVTPPASAPPPERALRILTVARLSRRDQYKGVDVALAAMAELRRRGCDFRYDIAGDGDDRARLEAVVAHHGLGKLVRFLGHVPEHQRMATYDACDVFLMCSREQPTPRGLGFEGFGIVYLEANARGKPAVGGRSGGTPDAIEDGVTGLLADPNSPGAVADALERLARDSALRGRLGAAGRARVQATFNWDESAARVRALHMEMSQRGSAAMRSAAVSHAGARPEVLFLATSGQVGGAERCLLTLAAALPAEGFAPAVCIGSEGPFADLLDAGAVPHVTVALPAGVRRLSRYFDRGWGASLMAGLRLPAYLWRLLRAIRRRRPAVVHSNGLKMHFISGLLQPWLGAPLVWHLHDFPADMATARPGASAAPAANRGLAWLSGAPDLVIANSEAVAAAYRQRFARLAPKIRVIHNGVREADFAGARGVELRQRLGLEPQDFVIGMVAIFAPWKGQEIFLQAARLARKAAPELRFALIGDDIYDTAGHGAQRAGLQALAGQLGLAEVVRFSGFMRDDIASAYAALDVMVHASTRPEPFGRTIIEAMASGVPVIAAAAGGVEEIITHGHDGWLTPPGDVAALAAAMLRLRADAALRAALAGRAATTVRSRFAAATIAHATAALYRELMPA